jgi:hypothetical protein
VLSLECRTLLVRGWGGLLILKVDEHEVTTLRGDLVLSSCFRRSLRRASMALPFCGPQEAAGRGLVVWLLGKRMRQTALVLRLP